MTGWLVDDWMTERMNGSSRLSHYPFHFRYDVDKEKLKIIFLTLLRITSQLPTSFLIQSICLYLKFSICHTHCRVHHILTLFLDAYLLFKPPFPSLTDSISHWLVELLTFTLGMSRDSRYSMRNIFMTIRPRSTCFLSTCLQLLMCSFWSVERSHWPARDGPGHEVHLRHGRPWEQDTGAAGGHGIEAKEYHD